MTEHFFQKKCSHFFKIYISEFPYHDDVLLLSHPEKKTEKSSDNWKSTKIFETKSDNWAIQAFLYFIDCDICGIKSIEPIPCEIATTLELEFPQKRKRCFWAR